MDREGSLDLSVVVPVWNESENVGPLIDEIVSALEGRLEYEIVYVDDGSDDETPRRLAGIARRNPRLRVLQHRFRCGQSRAIHTGVKAARASWVATLDGDGQNDPRDIPKLVALVRDPASSDAVRLVAGERRRRRDSWVKRVASRVANSVRALLLDDRIRDTGCGLKLIHRAAFLELPFFDHMHRFLPALVLREGFEVRSVTVNHRPRGRGRSKYGILDRLWVGLADLLGVWWLRRRAKPAEVIELDSGSPAPRSSEG